MQIKISGINISEKKGTTKKPVNAVNINKSGIIGDAHAGDWHRQISLLGRESIDSFMEKANRKIEPGEFAENIILEGIDFTTIKVSDRFQVNDVILEVTQIGKTCHGEGCPIFIAVGDCVMPREGVFAKVIQEGKIKNGDKVKYLSSSQ